MWQVAGGITLSLSTAPQHSPRFYDSLHLVIHSPSPPRSREEKANKKPAQ